MVQDVSSKRIRVGLVGIGNCAGSLVEGVEFYRAYPQNSHGLLFPTIHGYAVSDIDFVVGFDISENKVGLPIHEAIYQHPNNFVRNHHSTHSSGKVFRGPTLDGNPPHLAKLVSESPSQSVEVAEVLRTHDVSVLVSLLPTGSQEATRYYADSAINAGCAFVNCTPAIIAQDSMMRSLYEQRGLPLFGDDIKSQIGTTILHRALLEMLRMRGATLKRTTQINIGGNTDFVNFVHRAESKLISKAKSLSLYTRGVEHHVGHHYDPTQGAHKKALIDIEAEVFGGSPVKIAVTLMSDDKPNSAGSICDLIRFAQAALDCGITGVIPEVTAFYMKSPLVQIDDITSLNSILDKWNVTDPRNL